MSVQSVCVLMSACQDLLPLQGHYTFPIVYLGWSLARFVNLPLAYKLGHNLLTELPKHTE